MLAILIALLVWGLFWATLCWGLGAIRLATTSRGLGFAAIIYGLHSLALALPRWLYWLSWLDLTPLSDPNPAMHSVDWLGKAAGLLLSGFLVYRLHCPTTQEAGLRWPRPASLRVVAPVLALVATLLLVDAYLSRNAFPPLWWHEQLFFAVVPGLEEELFYRGILLGLLSRLFPRTIALPGTHTSWGGLMSVLLFVLGHGIHFPLHGLMLLSHLYGWLALVRFSITDVLFQLAMGLLFLWIRERTGSVWAAILAHCLANSCLILGHAMG